jgi:hypothetical protein
MIAFWHGYKLTGLEIWRFKTMMDCNIMLNLHNGGQVIDMRKFFVLLTIIIPLITAQVIAQNMIFVYPNQAGQLNAIMNGAPPGTWIVFADGIYQIPGYYDIHVDSLTLTSNSGNPQ